MNIDLNADVGEGLPDEALFEWVTSVNVACGGHAGDEQTMTRAVSRARETGAHLGAHPSYPDKENFGRRAMSLPAEALTEALFQQVVELQRIAAWQGMRVEHLKPHGALYHQASVDEATAKAVVTAALRADPALRIVGAPRSLLLRHAEEAGLATAAEGFADRHYLATGELVPRGQKDALIEEPAQAAAQAVQLATRASVVAVDGASVSLVVQTLCVHGDTPHAIQIARAVRQALEANQVQVRAP